MKNTAFLRSLTAITLGCVLFSGYASAETSLTNQAEQAWNSTAKTLSMAGDDAGNAITSGVNSVDSYAGDASLTAQVKSHLLATRGIDSNDISVKTVKGVVYITGTVQNAEQISTVVKVASAVEGVKLVKSGLMVIN